LAHGGRHARHRLVHLEQYDEAYKDKQFKKPARRSKSEVERRLITFEQTKRMLHAYFIHSGRLLLEEDPREVTVLIEPVLADFI
jgi:hypothetical protein